MAHSGRRRASQANAASGPGPRAPHRVRARARVLLDADQRHGGGVLDVARHLRHPRALQPEARASAPGGSGT